MPEVIIDIRNVLELTVLASAQWSQTPENAPEKVWLLARG
jgi:hypothetical protein